MAEAIGHGLATIALSMLLNFVGARAHPDGLNFLFPRDIDNFGCIQPCPEVDCLSCAPDVPLCIVISRNCTHCARVQCYPRPAKEDDGPSAGVIAGATIGAVVVALVLVFFIWKSRKEKKKRETLIASSQAEKGNDFGMLRSARASTHTVASIASTVYTRASNVIQIAYIPGVTNRSGPSTPALLNVPPVPPLPGASGSPSMGYPHSPNGDIQFAADDLLRGSVVTMPDNRSSIATTIYGGNAVIHQPITVRAGKAAVVSVKAGSSAGGSGSSSPDDTPPVPSLFVNQANNNAPNNGTSQNVGNGPPSPAFSIGSTFLSSRNGRNSDRKSDWESSASDGYPAPTKRLIPGRSHIIPENHSTSSYNYDSDDSELDLPPGHRVKQLQSQCSSCVTDMDTGSPFSDVNSVIDAMPLPPGAGLPPIMGGDFDRMSMNLSSASTTPRLKTISPFSDQNTIEESRRK